MAGFLTSANSASADNSSAAEEKLETDNVENVVCSIFQYSIV